MEYLRDTYSYSRSTDSMLIGTLPSWVEADPLRSRAIDALGLQSVSDNLADRLLPGLSVLTTRARYFTFLCWARKSTGATTIEEDAIHRLEVALMLTEAKLSASDPGHSLCAFVGSRNALKMHLDEIPSDPRIAYKFPVWRSYRASMASLGLVSADMSSRLTEQGEAAAKYFSKAIGRLARASPKPLPARACLSCMSKDEQRLMRDLLGLSRRGPIDPNSTNPKDRRALFAREVAARLGGRVGLSPGNLLPLYEKGNLADALEPARTLRIAAVWEYLTVGLNGLFLTWARAIEGGLEATWKRRLARALSNSPVRSSLATVRIIDPVDEHFLRTSVSSLRHSIVLHDKLSRYDSVPGTGHYELAKELLNGSGRAYIENWLARLWTMHTEAKGDDAWVKERHGRYFIDHDGKHSWKLPDRVAPHAYRLAAFDSMVQDLGGY